MARTPINARRAFMVPINRNLGQVRIFQWNAVDTDLGVMVEPHQFPHGAGVDGAVPQVDMLDCAYDSITMLDASTFNAQYGTDGPQNLLDFNY